MIFGKRTIGGTARTIAPDTKEVVRMAVPSAGYLVKVTAWLDGLGGGTHPASVVAAIYDVAGNLLGSSSPVTVPAGSAAAWYDFSFVGPLGDPGVSVAATSYDIGLQAGGADTVVRFFSGNAGTSRRNSDPFADGPANPLAGYSAAVLALAPSLYWRLAEAVGASVAGDASGNSRTGTISAGVTCGVAGLILGDPSTAASFNNGATAKVASAAYAPFATTVKRTFMGVASRVATTDADTLVGGTVVPTSGSPALRLVAGSQNVQFQANSNTGTILTWTAAWPGNAQSVHWALTYDDSTRAAELFINGVSKGVQSFAAGNGYTGVASDFFQIGMSGASTNPYNGTMDESAVFESILTATQILACFNAMPVAGTDDMTVYGDVFAPYEPSEDETEEYYARLPFECSQEVFLASAPKPPALSADATWHGTHFDPETGSFAVVRDDGPLADLVGQRLVVTTGTAIEVQRRVAVFVHSMGPVYNADISLTRRAFAAISGLAVGDSIPVQVEVLG